MFLQNNFLDVLLPQGQMVVAILRLLAAVSIFVESESHEFAIVHLAELHGWEAVILGVSLCHGFSLLFAAELSSYF